MFSNEELGIILAALNEYWNLFDRGLLGPEGRMGEIDALAKKVEEAYRPL